MSFYRDWEPYVPVAQRRANAVREASKLANKGKVLRPIRITARAIAKSFWGLAWCKNLEIYADWANRMPRGRTYARNGSIVDLQIQPGEITALVSGSSLYKIKISIGKLDTKKWKSIRDDCGQQVSSLLDLMRGKLPEVVLKRLTDTQAGMFPSPRELRISCSCPDSATVCKHVAATLYGVGHLLDTEPELFFKMRGVDQSELVFDAMSSQTASDAIGLDQQSDLAGEDLSAIFGIDLGTSSDVASTSTIKKSSTAKARKISAAMKTKIVAPAKSAKKSPPVKKVSATKKTATATKKQVSTKTKRRV